MISARPETARADQGTRPASRELAGRRPSIAASCGRLPERGGPAAIASRRHTAPMQASMLRRTATDMADALDRAAMRDVEGDREWRDAKAKRWSR